MDADPEHADHRTEAELVAEHYLTAVRSAAANLRPTAQDELVLDLREHIEETLLERCPPHATQRQRVAVIRQILDELGPPTEVAGTTDLEPEPAIPDQAGKRWDGAALAALLIGGFVVPTVGWVAGVVMVWLSPRWPRADKLLGTAAWPVAVAVPLAAATLPPDSIAPVTGLLAVAAMLFGWLPWVTVRLWRSRQHDETPHAAVPVH